MRLIRALTLLLLLVLLAPVTGVVSTASAGETAPEATQITIEGKPKRGVFHDDIGPSSTPDVVRHRGRLTDAGGDPVTGAAVQLRRQLEGGKWLTFAEEAVTDSTGRYEFFSYIEGNARYQARYVGDAIYAPSQSGEVKVKAMRDFNAVLVEKERYVLFKGNINPGWDNKVVRWERKTCKSCSWKKVDQQRTGDNGSWSFRGNYPPVNKKWTYRAAIDGSDLFVKSYSARLITTTVPGRQPAARTVSR